MELIDYQVVSPDDPAILPANSDRLKDVPLHEEEERVDRRGHLASISKRPKYDKTAVLISTPKCTTLIIIILGLTINPQVIRCECVETREDMISTKAMVPYKPMDAVDAVDAVLHQTPDPKTTTGTSLIPVKR